jgi:hypothetical protein
MPRSTVSAWTCNDDACPICTDPECDELRSTALDPTETRARIARISKELEE